MKKHILASLLIACCLSLAINLESADGKDRKEQKAAPQARQAQPRAAAPAQARPQPQAAPQTRQAKPRAAAPAQARPQPQATPQVRQAQPRAAPSPARQAQPRAVPQPRAAQQGAARTQQTPQRVINNYTRIPSLSRTGRGTPQTPKATPSARPAVQQQTRQIDPQRLTKPERSRVRDQAKQYMQRLKESRATRGTSPKAEALQTLPAARELDRDGGIDRHRDSDRKYSRHRDRDRDGARRVREKFRHDHRDHSEWFSDRFFVRHNYYPYYYRHGYDWWRPIGWGGIATWLAWDNIAPIYYDDGGYPVVQTIDVTNYSTQQTIFEGDWLPLGVFAAGRDVNQASLSNLFVQLAIDKDGDLAGTYYNATTDQVYQLEGAVDSETQQAVWKLTEDPNSPLMITGVYNLTQDIAPVQVQFSDGTEQSWIFVRLNE